MKVLILYATTEGQTRKIVRFLTDHIQDTGHHVTLIEAGDVPTAFDFADYDRILLAGSLHMGRYQPVLVHLARDNAVDLTDEGAVFLSVSLAAIDAEDQDDLLHCVEQFTHVTGWMPQHVEHVAGAFRFTQYDFFRRWAMKYIARKKGVDHPGDRDIEYTDWDALRRFADKLCQPLIGNAS